MEKVDTKPRRSLEELKKLYPGKIMDGVALAEEFKKELKNKIEKLKETKAYKIYEKPVLGYLLVGRNPDSVMYVRFKKAAAAELGVELIGIHLPEDTPQEEVCKHVKQLQDDPKVNGIICQLPLPSHINEQAVLELIGADKDADGIHPFNVGTLALRQKEPWFMSCTAHGVLKLIQSVCPDLRGKKVTLCGRNNFVGLPLALLLNKHDATISLCHRFTPNFQDYLATADIVVTAIGSPEYYSGQWMKEGAIIIDVGINVINIPDPSGPEGATKKKTVGDVDFESALDRCSYISPVPGGVGPMTVVMLMTNVVNSWERSNF